MNMESRNKKLFKKVRQYQPLEKQVKILLKCTKIINNRNNNKIITNNHK